MGGGAARSEQRGVAYLVLVVFVSSLRVARRGLEGPSVLRLPLVNPLLRLQDASLELVIRLARQVRELLLELELLEVALGDGGEDLLGGLGVHFGLVVAESLVVLLH